MGKLGLSLVLVTSLAFADKEAPPPASKPKPVATAAAKAPNKMSRTELETEVENLRAENAKLKQQVEALLREQKDRADRLQKALGSPAAKDLK